MVCVVTSVVVGTVADWVMPDKTCLVACKISSGSFFNDGSSTRGRFRFLGTYDQNGYRISIYAHRLKCFGKVIYVVKRCIRSDHLHRVSN
jgi:hypothetical protein